MPRLLMILALLVAGCHSSGPACHGVCKQPMWTQLTLLAGQPGGTGWVDGPDAAAHFSDPWTFALDAAGQMLYLADGQTLRAIDLAGGTVSTLAGQFGMVGGTDGPLEMATFNTPSGLAFTDGQLYLTDTENHSVRKIDLAQKMVTTVAGTFEQPGQTDAVGTDARFQEPEGLALDGAGNLYIADTDNNTIRVMALATGAVSTVAGSPRMSGFVNGVGDVVRFNKPKALSFGNGTLYVVDSLNNAIRTFDPATQTVATLINLPTQPEGLCLDGSDLLVSLADDTVVRVDPTGTSTLLAGGSNLPGFTDGAAADARFDGVAGLYNDGQGTLYLADEQNAAVRTLALPSGTVATLAGSKSSGNADGTGSTARFFAPEGLAAGSDVLYVSDSSNATIRQIVIASGEVSTLAGSAGQLGNADGAGADARFNAPQGIALDAAAQALYVADGNNRSIRKIDLSSGQVSTLVYRPVAGDLFRMLDSPAGLALDRGKLFIADYASEVILELDLAKAEMTTMAGKLGEPGGTDGAGPKARFYGPTGIAADGRGNLFVTDDLNDSVRKVVIATGVVSTVAGLATTPGSSDGTGSTARFQFPAGIAADGIGDLWVADSLNHTVRQIDAPSGAVTTVIGTPRISGVKLGALPAQLSLPSALALLPSGNLALVSENSVLLAQ
jgi:sugar lactone lactonase YvrE